MYNILNRPQYLSKQIIDDVDQGQSRENFKHIHQCRHLCQIQCSHWVVCTPKDYNAVYVTVNQLYHEQFIQVFCYAYFVAHIAASCIYTESFIIYNCLFVCVIYKIDCIEYYLIIHISCNF